MRRALSSTWAASSRTSSSRTCVYEEEEEEVVVMAVVAEAVGVTVVAACCGERVGECVVEVTLGGRSSGRCKWRWMVASFISISTRASTLAAQVRKL